MHGEEYRLFCGEIVKQLVRFVTYRRDGKIEGVDMRKPPKLSTTTFPDPLIAREDLIDWMNRIGFFYRSPDYAEFWRPHEDHKEYLRYWTMAFWDKYRKIHCDKELFMNLKEKLKKWMVPMHCTK